MESQTNLPCNSLFSQAHSFVQKSLITLKTFQIWTLSKIGRAFFSFNSLNKQGDLLKQHINQCCLVR